MTTKKSPSKTIPKSPKMTKPSARDALLEGKHVRTFDAQARAIDEEARTVELSFASAEPVERWFGMEVFDMRGGNLDRLNRSGAFLMDHNWTDQVGGIVPGSARVDADGIARCLVKMSRSQRGEEIFQDMIDEIRQSVSVGYLVHEVEVETGQANMPDTYRVTDWEPLEVSSVSVPADITVGVGRGFTGADAPTNPEPAGGTSQEDETMTDDVIETPEQGDDAAKAAPSIGGSERGNPDKQREADFAKMRKVGERYGFAELAEQMVDLEQTPADLQREIAKRLNNAYPVNTAPSEPAPSRMEQRLVYKPKSLEKFKGDEERAYRAGMWARATLFNDPNAIRWCKDAGVRAQVTSSNQLGGVLVPSEMESSIIDLREAYGVARRLARVYPMNSDTLMIGRRVNGVTAYFAGEETATTESEKEWDSVSLVARELSALSRVSMSLAEDAVIDVAADLADEMAYAFAVKEDECLVDGDGTSTYGGIQGLRNKIIAGSLAGAVDAASGIDTIPEVTATDLDNVRAALPEYAEMRGPVWLVSKAFKNKVHDAITRAAGGNTMEILAGAPRSAYLGDEIVVSQAMPKSLSTDYSNVAMAFYGAFDLAVAMGDRRGFTIQVLTERYAEYRQIGVLAHQRFDINVHSLGNATDAGPVVGLIGE